LFDNVNDIVDGRCRIGRKLSLLPKKAPETGQKWHFRDTDSEMPTFRNAAHYPWFCLNPRIGSRDLGNGHLAGVIIFAAIVSAVSE
jgi:hypothetical protein